MKKERRSRYSRIPKAEDKGIHQALEAAESHHRKCPLRLCFMPVEHRTVRCVDESVTVYAEYGGEDIDPLTQEDEISSAIVKGVAPEIKHTFEDGKNRIMFFVRNPK